MPQDEQRHSNFFTLDVTSSLASMTMLEQAALPFVKLQSSVGIAKPNSSVGSTLFKPWSCMFKLINNIHCCQLLTSNWRTFSSLQSTSVGDQIDYWLLHLNVVLQSLEFRIHIRYFRSLTEVWSWSSSIIIICLLLNCPNDANFKVCTYSF